jgi:uncharacterized membrane protein
MHIAHKKTALLAIAFLALIGIGVSGYALYLHEVPSAASFCNINAVFSCDKVNRSAYAELFGVPIALIGMLGYGFMSLTAVLHAREPHHRRLGNILVASSMGGFGFSGYLTGLEAFVIDAWCLVCLVSQTLILLITAASLFVLLHKWHVPEAPAPDAV